VVDGPEHIGAVTWIRLHSGYKNVPIGTRAYLDNRAVENIWRNPSLDDQSIGLYRRVHS
jgi:hypothetical protein